MHQREVDAEAGPLPDRAIDRDMAADLIHDSVTRGEAQPRTSSERFCREERLEDLRHDVAAHPHTRVADGQKHVLARGKLKSVDLAVVLEADITGGDRQRPAVRHRVPRIYREIDQHLLELAKVPFYRAEDL